LAPGVPRPLQSARVCERDGDEKTRDAQRAQKVKANLDDGRLVRSSSITSEVIVSQQIVRDYAERRGKRLDDRVVVCKHAPVPLAEAQTAPTEK